MSRPPVSVVMPVHNGMPFVGESVASILGQSFGAFELVIGDDGSDDGTAELLERWARRDSRVRLARRERKSGIAASFNWVMSLARAPLVAIAHADDLAHPERLRRQVAALRARPDAAAVGALSRGIDARGRLVQPPNYWRLTRVSPFAPFVHSSVMLRRDRFERAGGYDAQADYWEDLDLYWRLLETGPILVLPEILSSYRHSHASVRSRESVERVENALELMYRSTACYAARRDHRPLLRRGAAAVVGAGAKIHPRIFVARSWTEVWSGRRPGTLLRLLKRGDLGWNRASLVSLAFVTAATLSPRALRLIVQAWMHGRNLAGRRLLRGRAAVEWRTRPATKEDLPIPEPAHANSARSGSIRTG